MASPGMTPERSEEADLRVLLSQITSYSLEKLVRKEELGTQFNFGACEEAFSRMLLFCGKLGSADLSFLPAAKLTAIKKGVGDLQHSLQQITAFSLRNNNNPDHSRNNLIQNFQQVLGAFFDIASPSLAYALAESRESLKVQEELQKIFSEVRKGQEEAAEIIVQMHATLEASRKAAEQVGVTSHERLFSSEALEHQASATAWLRATGILAGGTVLVAIVSFLMSFFLPHGFSPTEAVQLGLGKFVLFSILITAVIWCGRIYKSHQHNYVVNKHRQNALSSFESFVQAAEGDAQTKNAVLLQATTCIFSPQSTGYADKDEAKSNPTQVLEIFRGLSEK